MRSTTIELCFCGDRRTKPAPPPKDPDDVDRTQQETFDTYALKDEATG